MIELRCLISDRSLPLELVSAVCRRSAKSASGRRHLFRRRRPGRPVSQIEEAGNKESGLCPSRGTACRIERAVAWRMILGQGDVLRAAFEFWTAKAVVRQSPASWPQYGRVVRLGRRPAAFTSPRPCVRLLQPNSDGRFRSQHRWHRGHAPTSLLRMPSTWRRNSERSYRRLDEGCWAVLRLWFPDLAPAAPRRSRFLAQTSHTPVGPELTRQRSITRFGSKRPSRANASGPASRAGASYALGTMTKRALRGLLAFSDPLWPEWRCPATPIPVRPRDAGTSRT